MSPQQREQLTVALALVAQGGSALEQGARMLFGLVWRRLVADYQRAGLPLGTAEDLASEAFIKMYGGLADLREPQAADKWIQTVGRNTLINHWRDTAAQRQHEQAVDDEALLWLADSAQAGHSQADAQGADPATWLCLRRQLEQFCLAHPERAYWLEQVVLQGWAMPELGQALGRTLGATREYLSQCRKALQRYFAECRNEQAVT